MTNEYLAVLAKHKIVVPPELLPIRRLDYHMSSDGWYLQVECGDWYWYDNRTAQWLHAPLGRTI